MLGKAPGSRRRHGVPRPRGRRRAAREGGGPRQGRRRDQRARLGRHASSACASTRGTPSGPYRDVIEVVENAGERLDEIMLPKVQSAAEVVALDLLLTQIEKATGRQSATSASRRRSRPRAGLINVEEICAASPTGWRRSSSARPTSPASMEMPVAHRRRADPRVPGRPLPLRVLEDPHGRPRQRPAGDRRPVPQDPRARRLPRLLRCARRILGYDGKWALHPDQVDDPQRGVHADARSSSTSACDILEAYEKATTEGDRKGAVMFGDEMIDEAQPQDGDQVRVAAASGPG